MSGRVLFPIFIICVIFFQSCHHAPTASFTADKDEYSAGETIQLTNTSSNAYSYKWEAPGLTTPLTGKNASIIARKKGTYQVTLTVFSKNGKKSSSTSKTVVVKAGKGQLVIYTSTYPVLPISIKIDNVPAGVITQTFSNPPFCGATGCVNAELEGGEHQFEMTANGMTVPFTGTIDAGECNQLKVF
jgi:PKD repeat protein